MLATASWTLSGRVRQTLTIRSSLGSRARAGGAVSATVVGRRKSGTGGATRWRSSTVGGRSAGGAVAVEVMGSHPLAVGVRFVGRIGAAVDVAV